MPIHNPQDLTPRDRRPFEVAFGELPAYAVFQPPALSPEATAKFENVLSGVYREHVKLEEKLTEEQFIEAMRQALACGDFLRLCTPAKSSCDGITYTCSVAQAITYEPFRECSRLRARIAELEADLDRRQQDEIESDL